MKNNIAILLSTFQSEPFLERLLDSILNQSYTDWQLYIRDDGSMDNTISIIKKYIINKRIILLNDEVQNRGPKDSFFWLLENVQADYYMFCDHDDVWLPEKIEISFNKMRKLESYYTNEIPILIHSDLTVVDSELNIIAESFWHYSHLEKFITCPEFLPYFNFITGCTMIINQSAKTISIQGNSNAIMHDSWIALKTLSHKGIIHGVSNPLILYCQHNHNSIGAKKYNSSILYRFIKLRDIINFNIRWFQMQKQVTHINLLKYLYYKLFIYIKRSY